LGWGLKNDDIKRRNGASNLTAKPAKGTLSIPPSLLLVVIPMLRDARDLPERPNHDDYYGRISDPA